MQSSVFIATKINMLEFMITQILKRLNSFLLFLSLKMACPHGQATSSNTFLNFHLISYRSSRYTLTSFIIASTISFVSTGSLANKEIFSSSFSCSSSTYACISISLLNSATFFSAASISASQACFTARY